MSYRLLFNKEAQVTAKKWAKSNPSLHKKFKCILQEISEHPHTGTGHPEPLKNGQGITYSRRITASERIIYDIYEDVVEVLVVELGGHYDDK